MAQTNVSYLFTIVDVFVDKDILRLVVILWNGYWHKIDLRSMTV